MVVVLPWHDPMRVAEQISMLDHLSGGRMILGLGRGAGKVEFDGFRLDMGDSRELFVEYGEALLKGLESGVMEYARQALQAAADRHPPRPVQELPRPHLRRGGVPGERAHHGQARRRPADHPAEAVARGREGAAPSTTRSIARSTARDAPQPISAGWIFVDESAERAREMAMRYIGGYYHTVLDHYQFGGEHLKNQRGYEYYAKMNEKLAVYGDQKAIEFFVDLQVCGTPEQFYDKIMTIHEQTNNRASSACSPMPACRTRRRSATCACSPRTVMPELQKFDAGAPIDRALPLPDHRARVSRRPTV